MEKISAYYQENRITVMAFLLIILLALTGLMIITNPPVIYKHTLETETDNRTILVSYDVGDNYIHHLYAIANEGLYDQEYYNKYKTTVSSKDADFLRKYYDKIGFESEGGYSKYLYFIPAKYDFDSKAKWKIYFDDLIKMIESEDYSFIDKYNLQDALSIETIQQSSLDVEILKGFAKVYEQNFSDYINKVWRDIETPLFRRAKGLNDLTFERSYIDLWEQATLLKSPYKEFQVDLVYTSSTGLKSNSIGGNKAIVASDYTEDDTAFVELMNREIGVQLIMSFIASDYESYRSKYHGLDQYGFHIDNLLYLSFEEFVAYYNGKIFGRPTVDRELYYTEEDHVLYDVIIPARDDEEDSAKHVYKRVMDYYFTSRLSDIPVVIDNQVRYHGKVLDKIGVFTDGTEIYSKDHYGIVFKEGDKLKVIKEYGTFAKLSKDRTRLLYLDQYDFETNTNVFIYDITTKTEIAITQYESDQSTTAKFVEWIDNEVIGYISGYAYGTVSHGGVIHILKPDGQERIISNEDEDEAYVSFKVRGQKLIAKKIIWDKERINYKEFVEIIELGEL